MEVHARVPADPRHGVRVDGRADGDRPARPGERHHVRVIPLGEGYPLAVGAGHDLRRVLALQVHDLVAALQIGADQARPGAPAGDHVDPLAGGVEPWLATAVPHLPRQGAAIGRDHKDAGVLTVHVAPDAVAAHRTVDQPVAIR